MTNNLPPRPSDETEPKLPDYGDRAEYYGQPAAVVALELFGEDLSGQGIFYSAAGSDKDVPFRVVARGNNSLTTYNMLHSEDTAAGSQGIAGHVISRREANELAGLPTTYAAEDNRSESRPDTDR